MSAYEKLGDDLLFPAERDWGDFYCSTIKQLRRKSFSINLSIIAKDAGLDPSIVRKLNRGEFSKPFVGHIEAINKAMNNGVLTITQQVVLPGAIREIEVHGTFDINS